MAFGVRRMGFGESPAAVMLVALTPILAMLTLLRLKLEVMLQSDQQLWRLHAVKQS